MHRSCVLVVLMVREEMDFTTLKRRTRSGQTDKISQVEIARSSHMPNKVDSKGEILDEIHRRIGS